MECYQKLKKNVFKENYIIILKGMLLGVIVNIIIFEGNL